MSKDISQQKLPLGWQWKHLGDVCTQDRQIIDGQSAEAKSLTYYSLEHIESESGNFLKTPLEKIEDEGRSTTFRFDERHVLYGKLRPYLNKVATPGTPGRCTTEMIPLLPSGGVDRFFLAWILRRRETVEYALQGKTGSRMPRADMDHLLKLSVPLPPLPEQQRIAALLTDQLTAVDKARHAAQARLEAIKDLPAAYLCQVFPQPGQPLPSGWRWVKIGEVCKVKGGKRLPMGTDFAGAITKHPYIRVTDFVNGSVCTDALKYLDGDTQTAISRYIIQKEDVYISIAGTIGVVGTIPDSLDGANLTENAARLVISDKNLLSKDYLAGYLNSDLGQNFINTRTNVVGQPKLALTRIETIPIPLAPLSEQERIATLLKEELAAVDKARCPAESELATINALPAALLRRAFNGEL